VAETNVIDTPEISTADLLETPARGTESMATARREAHAEAEQPTPLFAHEETDELRRRWMDVQTGFVDDPRASVQSADSLVAQTMKRLAEIFAAERANLEGQWSRGDEVGTEDLRQAMRRYRSFFDRLLSV
jgi:hypothetical protein